MPRVQVVIQVLDDEGSRVARSAFFIGENATSVLLEEAAPVELAQDLGEIFTTSLHEQFPTLGFQTLSGELHVTSSPELPESLREILHRRLTPFARRPVSPETLAAVRQEIEAFRAEYPGQLVIPPSEDPNAQIDLSGIDFAEMEAQLLARGHFPAVSMGTAVHDPLEAIFQAPAPPDESNPVSRRIRGALRAVVGSEGEDTDQRLRALTSLSQLGAISRRTLLEAAGLNENSTRQELEEALGRQNQDSPPQDPIRGRMALGVMIDDAAHFDVASPVFTSDRHVADPPTPRQAVALEHFRAIYGGDPGSRPTRSSGTAPPKDRSVIPTRYHRKPVI